MKQSIKFLVMLTLIAGVATFYACSDDDGGSGNGGAIALSSLTSGTTDLNGATAATGVSVDMPIVATFSKDVDEATTDGIAITRTFDDADVPVTVTVDGKVVTITPVNDMSGGAQFELSVTGLKSEGGASLTSVSRLFTTGGTFAPDGVMAHFTFENNVNDVVGAYDPANAGTAVTYVDSRNAAAGKAASFNGTTTIIEVPNGDDFMENGDFALSFWVKVDASKESHFVMGLGGWYGFQFEILGGAWTATDKGVKLATRYQLATTTDAEDTWWNGNPNGWQGSIFAKDVVAEGGISAYFKDKWAHVVCTYVAATKIGTMYVNGERVRAFDFNLWPADAAKKAATGVTFAGNTTGGGNNLAIGFIQASGNRVIADEWADPSITTNNHFKGLLDDIRIYDRPITAQEVELMYNSEKP